MASATPTARGTAIAIAIALVTNVPQMKGRAPKTARPSGGLGIHSVPVTKPQTPNASQTGPVSETVVQMR